MTDAPTPRSAELSAEERDTIWTHGSDWTCPHCQTVNMPIRDECRSCGYDSNAGESPSYNPLPPYQGRPW